MILEYISPELPAGTYKVSLQWNSTIDATGSNYLAFNHKSGFDVERTLIAYEYK